MGYQYELSKTEDGKDIEIGRNSVIEKRGHVIKFTLEELSQNHVQLEKLDKELTAQSEHERAKMKNIEEHHAFVLGLSDEDLFTAHMYANAKALLTQCEAKRKEIADTLISDRQEIADIKAQIPGLDVPEPVAIPQRPGGVMEAINEAQQNSSEA